MSHSRKMNQPMSVGSVLIQEYMEPKALTQSRLAQAMGVSRRTVNEICTNRRHITPDTALMLSRVFGNQAGFWLDLQQQTDLWEAINTPRRRARIEKSQPLHAA